MSVDTVFFTTITGWSVLKEKEIVAHGLPYNDAYQLLRDTQRNLHDYDKTKVFLTTDEVAGYNGNDTRSN